MDRPVGLFRAEDNFFPSQVLKYLRMYALPLNFLILFKVCNKISKKNSYVSLLDESKISVVKFGNSLLRIIPSLDVLTSGIDLHIIS